MDNNRIILPITPQTGIKIVQDTTVLFRMPEDCQVACGLPRRDYSLPMVRVDTMKDTHPDLWEALGGENWKPRKKKKEIRYGCPHCLSKHGLWLKNRILKMNKYREDLLFLAKKAGFELPVCGWSLYFYMPMPVQWSKKKREMMNGQMNLSKPDCKNMLAIFEDALSKTDERNSQMSGIGKFWVDSLRVDENGEKHRGEGYIEILLNQPLYNPFGVEFIDQTNLDSKIRRKRTKRNPGYEKKQNRKKKPIVLRTDILK